MVSCLARAIRLIAIAYLAVAGAHASVYRCTDDAGVPLFSQYPCATTPNVAATAISSVSVITPLPLTKAELATLEQIQRDFQRSKAAAARDRRRARRRNARNLAERAKVCARSRDALKQLRERKRNGYSLSNATALTAREADLKAKVHEHC